MSNFLTEKAGPLPVWAWGVILGGVAAAVLWFGGRGSSGGATGNVGGASGSTIDPGVLDSAYGYTPANTAGTSSTAGTIVNDSEEGTNFVWQANAVAYLLTQRFGGLAAQQATSRYLNGDSLDAEQQKMINLAIEKFGLPPQGVYSDSATSSAPEVETGETTTYYIRKPGTGAVYAVYKQGRRWITWPEYVALGHPSYYEPDANDPVWSKPVIGPDAPLNQQ